MNNVVCLRDYKDRKIKEQHIQTHMDYYMKNFQTIFNIHLHRTAIKQQQRKSEKQLQLGYMKLLTNLINK